jgi:ubiquinone/menaquinone biosynthesis C-methylase UbiE
MTPDFSTRSTAPEIMDDLDYAGDLMDKTLRELEIINRWLGGNHVTITALKKLLKTWSSDTPIHIVDLGCGRGDMLRLIKHWAKANNIAVKLTGIDANPYIVAAAQKNLQHDSDIELLTVNILSEQFRRLNFDVVIGTLFFHHFTNNELVDFFKTLKVQARLGLIINDIHRHPIAFHSIRILTQLFSKSSMVKYDAPLSVLRAFKKHELIEILQQSELKPFSINWKWAFRWQILAYTSSSAKSK